MSVDEVAQVEEQSGCSWRPGAFSLVEVASEVPGQGQEACRDGHSGWREVGQRAASGGGRLFGGVGSTPDRDGAIAYPGGALVSGESGHEEVAAVAEGEIHSSMTKKTLISHLTTYAEARKKAVKVANIKVDRIFCLFNSSKAVFHNVSIILRISSWTVKSIVFKICYSFLTKI